MEDIIKKLKTDDERFDILNKALSVASENTIGFLAQELRKIRRSYDDTNIAGEEKEDRIVSADQLKRLEKTYLKQMKDIDISGALLDTEDFLYAFYLWQDLDNEAANLFLEEIFKDDIKKLKFFCFLAGSWSGTKGSGWSYSHSNYSDYFCGEEIYKQIQDLDKNNLDDFNEQQLIKLASFYLNYGKDEFYNVTEQQAKELVNEWRKCAVKNN